MQRNHYDFASTKSLSKLLDGNAVSIKEVLDLIKKGADPNTKNTKGHSALQCLYRTNFRIKDAMRLIKHGADVNTVSVDGNTLLYFLTRPVQDTLPGRDLIVKRLINEFHAKLDIPNRNGGTAFGSLFEGREEPQFELAMEFVRAGMKKWAFVYVDGGP